MNCSRVSILTECRTRGGHVRFKKLNPPNRAWRKSQDRVASITKLHLNPHKCVQSFLHYWAFVVSRSKQLSIVVRCQVVVSHEESRPQFPLLSRNIQT